jgi:hypothetical protein
MNSRAVFLGAQGMWDIGRWHWSFLGLTIAAAIWLWHARQLRWPLITALIVSCVDITWHVTNPITTAYMHLVNPGFLALNMTAVLLIWQISHAIRLHEHHTRMSALVMILPTIIGWNIFVSHSPLTAVYAEIYGGGDTLIGQGSSSLFLFVAMWSGVWIWMRQNAVPIGSFTTASVILAFSQIIIQGEWRFLIIVIGAACIVEWCHHRWPQRWHLNSVLWTLGFGGGYFMTLHFTTVIAWPTTVWGGILIIMILISYALARISNPYTTPAGAH